MRRVVAVLCVWACVSGCDWDQASLLNGVSIRRPVTRGRVFNVYLGVDGVSWPSMVEAQSRGAFPNFALAKSIPMFPATSDASWTRIFHTTRFGGYEYTWYDHDADKVFNDGLGGLLGHGLPHASGSNEFPYYEAFDLHGAGYFDGAEKYSAPELTYRAAVDQLFVVLEGRLAGQTSFTGYLLEMDVIGHYGGQRAMVQMLVELSDRIERFKASHPDITLKFTLFSDHGLDNVKKERGCLVGQDEVLRSVGVEPADSFAEAARKEFPVWAVAPEHTRVTYGTLNTRPELVSEVARRVSTSPWVDLVVARAEPPEGAPKADQWVSLFLGGNEVVRFGFDPATDTYWLPTSGDYAQLDVAPAFTIGGGWEAFTDEALFAASADRWYPDLFYRARTSLLPISVRNTAEILFSLKEQYALKGFNVPGTEDTGAGASHGSMGGEGSLAMVLTDERELPPVIRSESILELFPALKDHLEARGLPFVEGDPGASLDLSALFGAR